MNYNILGYLIFGLVIYVITFHVGWVFYRNGKHFLERVFHEDLQLVDSVNHLLLVGYYLLNLGYASLSIVYWPEISSTSELIACVSEKSGTIILTLGCMHYINMATVLVYNYVHYKKENQSLFN